MTSKDTRSDATGRQMLHHPVQTLKDQLTVHHEHKRERGEDKENIGRAVHFPHQDAHEHDNENHDDHHEHDRTLPASAGQGKDSSTDQNDAAGGHPSQHHVSDPDHSRAEDVARDFLGRSEEHRTVRDPITHTLLRNVRDVTNEEYQGGLSEAARVKQVLQHPDSESKENPSSERWAGTSARPAFPYKHGLAAAPGTPAIIQRLERYIGYILYTLVLCWVVILAVHTKLPETSLFALFAIVSVPFARQMIVRRLQDALSDFDAVCEEDRGEQIGRTHWPESAEWANKVLSEIWPAIQPEMFDSLRDTLEDLLQANVPSFLSEVKVADFTQGANPLRILSVSLLPDTEWKVEKDGPRENKSEGGEDPLTSEVCRAEQEAQKELDVVLPADEDGGPIWIEAKLLWARPLFQAGLSEPFARKEVLRQLETMSDLGARLGTKPRLYLVVPVRLGPVLHQDIVARDVNVVVFPLSLPRRPPN